jgi:hypothetical protein
MSTECNEYKFKKARKNVIGGSGEVVDLCQDALMISATFENVLGFILNGRLEMGGFSFRHIPPSSTVSLIIKK